MQAVQTRTCLRTPDTMARTRFKFGFQRRRRVLLAWLITLPKAGPLPHNSHFIAIVVPDLKMLEFQALYSNRGARGRKALDFEDLLLKRLGHAIEFAAFARQIR
jgi:hypothetical protein